LKTLVNKNDLNSKEFVNFYNLCGSTESQDLLCFMKHILLNEDSSEIYKYKLSLSKDNEIIYLFIWSKTQPTYLSLKNKDFLINMLKDHIYIPHELCTDVFHLEDTIKNYGDFTIALNCSGNICLILDKNIKNEPKTLQQIEDDAKLICEIEYQECDFIPESAIIYNTISIRNTIDNSKQQKNFITIMNFFGTNEIPSDELLCTVFDVTIDDINPLKKHRHIYYCSPNILSLLIWNKTEFTITAQRLCVIQQILNDWTYIPKKLSNKLAPHGLNIVYDRKCGKYNAILSI
jgi:hypothetical protein